MGDGSRWSPARTKAKRRSDGTACPGTPCPLAHFRQDWAEPDRVVLIPTGSCKDRSRGKGWQARGGQPEEQTLRKVSQVLSGEHNRRDEGIRTPDLYSAIVALSPLALE